MMWVAYYYVRDCRIWCKPTVRHYLPVVVEGRTKREALQALRDLDNGESGYTLFVEQVSE